LALNPGRKPIIACFLAATLAMPACGNSNKSGRAATVDPTTSSTTQSVTTAPFTQAQLQNALLALSDMPTGYATEPVDNSPATGVCGKPSVSSRIPSDAEAKSEFSKSTFGPFLADTIDSYKSVDVAKNFISTEQADASSCTTFKDPSDGSDIIIAPLSFPQLGDETFAVRVTTTIPVDLIFIRKANVLVYVGFGGLNVDSSQTETFARQALTKAESVLKI
jgi:hypothetical protein